VLRKVRKYNHLELARDLRQSWKGAGEIREK
jgi:hypothetical protein